MPGFYKPLVLLFLLVLPLIYYYFRMALKKKKNEAMKFSHLSFIKSALGNSGKIKRSNRLFYMSLIIIGLMIIGFAEPHIPLEQTKEGVNVVLVIDISGSMKAQDYTPNRIESAKASAQVLLESLDVKDHAGIVLFESGATTASYLSPDKKRVIEKLKAVKPRDGATAIGDGLSLGIDMAVSIPNKKNVVILLSDGVSNAGVINPQEAVQFAVSNKIQVHTIGLGSTEPVVLGTDWFGNPQYAELDEETLKAIARYTGGSYFKSVDDKTLADIYKEIGDDIEREKEETIIKDWFFILALIVLLVQVYLRYGKDRIIQ